jgi:hypothetical protein
MKYIWLKTQDLHNDGNPLSKEEIQKEIKGQGLDKLLDHIMWSGYMVFARQRADGEIKEINRTKDGYIHRKGNSEWELLEPGLVRKKIEKAFSFIK